MRIITYAPLKTDLRLAPGVTPSLDSFGSITAALRAGLPGDAFTVLNLPENARRAYAVLSEDVWDLRLFVWHPDDTIRIHVYPGALAIAEVTLDDVPAGTASELERWSQDETEARLCAHFDAFRAALDRARQALPDYALDTGRGAAPEREVDFDITRISRTLLVTPQERAEPAVQALVTDWLAATIRPFDADAINAGTLDMSMSWVNYVIVDVDAARTREFTATMRIAQYFWSAQEWLNAETQAIIAGARTRGRTRTAEARLTASRSRMQMLQVEYNALRSVLSRAKEARLQEILSGWSYDTLAANGALLVEMSSNRLSEIAARRADRSSLFTDMILVGIGLFAVLDVLVGLLAFSREINARPALQYTDSGVSQVLSVFADLNTDTTLFGGGFVVLVLLGVYLVARKAK
ncbi:hypothetical protein [Glycocaulis sp.]|uniref:hypothetical protein n=1 Tax=Glycocaulis sp. TaxID=1969725 RepID=UPI003F6F2944